MRGETGPVALRPVRSTAPVGFYPRLLLTCRSPAEGNQELEEDEVMEKRVSVSLSQNETMGQMCCQIDQIVQQDNRHCKSDNMMTRLPREKLKEEYISIFLLP